MQPGEQSLDLQSLAIAPQHPATLRGPLGLMTAMHDNGFDILGCQPPIVRIAEVAPPRSISRDDQDEMHFNSRFDPGDWIGVSRRCGDGDWNTSAFCHRPDLRTLALPGFPTAKPQSVHPRPTVRESAATSPNAPGQRFLPSKVPRHWRTPQWQGCSRFSLGVWRSSSTRL